MIRKNKFNITVGEPRKKKFSKKVIVLLTIAIILTGLIAIVGVCGAAVIFHEKLWKTEGLANVIQELLIYLSDFIFFISFIVVAVKEEFTIKPLLNAVLVIGSLFTVFSLINPHLPGYAGTFKILSIKNFTLFDGQFFIPGITFLLFGNLLRKDAKAHPAEENA